ncbi:hypothetical protein THAOC_24687, partial [Thalassiosira oceanica]
RAYPLFSPNQSEANTTDTSWFSDADHYPATDIWLDTDCLDRSNWTADPFGSGGLTT